MMLLRLLSSAWWIMSRPFTRTCTELPNHNVLLLSALYEDSMAAVRTDYSLQNKKELTIVPGRNAFSHHVISAYAEKIRHWKDLIVD